MWAFFILGVCLLSPKYIPNVKFELIAIDKVVHLGLFFVLNFLFLFSLRRNDSLIIKKKSILILFLCVFYGAAIEYLQMITRLGRNAEWDDIIANSLGSIFAFLWFIFTNRFLNKNNRQVI